MKEIIINWYNYCVYSAIDLKFVRLLQLVVIYEYAKEEVETLTLLKQIID